MHKTVVVWGVVCIAMGVVLTGCGGGDTHPDGDSLFPPLKSGCERGQVFCNGNCVEESAASCGAECKSCPVTGDGVAVCEDGNGPLGNGSTESGGPFTVVW